MSLPKRVQMTRQRPWRAEHPDAVIVDRRTKWGNPIRVTRRWEKVDTFGRERWMWNVHGSPMDRNGGPSYASKDTARFFAVRHFQWDLLNARFGDAYPSIEEIKAELAGKDLACWCPLTFHRNGTYDWGHCHADILLEIADPDYFPPELEGR